MSDNARCMGSLYQVLKGEIDVLIDVLVDYCDKKFTTYGDKWYVNTISDRNYRVLALNSLGLR